MKTITPTSFRSLVCAIVAFLACASLSFSFTSSFDDAASLDSLSSVQGLVEVDTTRARTGAGSLKIAPGAEAHLELRAEDGGAHVEMWVYDDMTVPADPDLRRTGARWGLEQSDTRFLGPALIYAPYVTTDVTYVSTDKAPSGNWYSLQYLTQASRVEGWRKWVFDMDPADGLTWYIDDVEIVAFKWENTNFEGMIGLAFFGDVDDADGQSIWIDDVTVELKGAMEILPDGSPAGGEPEDPVPAIDPAYDGPPLDLLPALKDVHPRLLFTEGDLAQMKSFYDSGLLSAVRFRSGLDSYASATRSGTPTTAFLTNDTEGQRFGLWQLPTVAMHYLLSGETSSFDHAVEMLQLLLGEEVWQSGTELQSGMSAGNVLLGAALAYDWLYNDLDPTFREEFRVKLWYQARAMYYLGHLRGLEGNHYWQGDPQNNHRFHRDGGLVLATLAAYTGADEEKWFLSKVKEEVEFVVSWLPIDGSNHESPNYKIFGQPYLTFAAQATDHTMGTNLLDHPYFTYSPFFRLHATAPGFDSALYYGDDSGGFGYYNNSLYLPIWRMGDANLNLAMDRLRANQGGAFSYPWMIYPFQPEDLSASGSLDVLPTKMHYPDLDVAFFRDGWEEGDVAAMFKCGPMGGRQLNAYRDANDFAYINVAHDDPDANTFSIWKDGALIVRPDGYSYSKKSANHNTVLVDGYGQRMPGRPEGGHWSQPSTANETMADMASFTGWKDAGGITFAEGEASGSYIDSTINRFRRSFIWNEGKYVLMLDDLRADASKDFTWLVQANTVTEVNVSEKRYQLVGPNGATLDLQSVSNVALSGTIGDSPADQRGNSLGLRQLQFSASGTSVQIATVFDLWDNAPSVAITMTDADHATIVVTGSGYVDTWNWTSAVDNQTAGQFTLTSSDGQSLDSIEDPAEEFLDGINYRVDSWIRNGWFGWAYADHYPWYYSMNHGWLYAAGPGGEGAIYFWSPDEGWLYTSSQIYPWVFAFDEKEWTYRGD